jgi:hypothetical protein
MAADLLQHRLATDMYGKLHVSIHVMANMYREWSFSIHVMSVKSQACRRFSRRHSSPFTLHAFHGGLGYGG